MGKATKKSDKSDPKSDVQTTETASRGRGRRKAARGRGVPPVDPAPALPESPTRARSWSRSSRSPTPPPGEPLTRYSPNSSQHSNNAAVIASDEHGAGALPKSKKKKVTNPIKPRKIKASATISEAREIMMVEWLKENPMVWNPKINAYKDTGKRLKRWEDQAQLLDPSNDEIKDGAHLQRWFRSLRDIHVKLDKESKSGAGARDLTSLTERETWINTQFTFLKGIIRHRREPLVSVRTAIQNTGGDLTAAEAACAEEAADGAPGDTTPDVDLPCTSRRATKRILDAADRAAVECLKKKVTDSTDLLKQLAAKPKDQPANEREVFGQYVHSSLLTMSKARFKKTRLVINNLLTQFMEEDAAESEEKEEEVHEMQSRSDHRPGNQGASTSTHIPGRPMSTPAPGYFGACVYPNYQPPPHQLQCNPPQGSGWDSLSTDYMSIHYAQPVFPQQQLQQQQRQQHQTNTSLCNLSNMSSLLGGFQAPIPASKDQEDGDLLDSTVTKAPVTPI